MRIALVQVMAVSREMRAGRLGNWVPRRHLDGTRKLVDPRNDEADQG